MFRRGIFLSLRGASAAAAARGTAHTTQHIARFLVNTTMTPVAAAAAAAAAAAVHPVPTASVPPPSSCTTASSMSVPMMTTGVIAAVQWEQRRFVSSSQKSKKKQQQQQTKKSSQEPLSDETGNKKKLKQASLPGGAAQVAANTRKGAKTMRQELDTDSMIANLRKQHLGVTPGEGLREGSAAIKARAVEKERRQREDDRMQREDESKGLVGHMTLEELSNPPVNPKLMTRTEHERLAEVAVDMGVTVMTPPAPLIPRTMIDDDDAFSSSSISSSSTSAPTQQPPPPRQSSDGGVRPNQHRMGQYVFHRRSRDQEDADIAIANSLGDGGAIGEGGIAGGLTPQAGRDPMQRPKTWLDVLNQLQVHSIDLSANPRIAHKIMHDARTYLAVLDFIRTTGASTSVFIEIMHFASRFKAPPKAGCIAQIADWLVANSDNIEASDLCDIAMLICAHQSFDYWWIAVLSKMEGGGTDAVGTG